MDYQAMAQALHQSLMQVVQKTSGFLPNLLGAIALLIGGWLTARILRFACVRIVGGMDGLLRRYGMDRLLTRVGKEFSERISVLLRHES